MGYMQKSVLSEKKSEALSTKALVTNSANRESDFLKLVNYVGSQATLVFCNQRATVERVSNMLSKTDIEHDIFHGGLEQKDRELALIKFKNGSHNILITTDLAARGLDIPSIQHIIHYCVICCKYFFIASVIVDDIFE